MIHGLLTGDYWLNVVARAYLLGYALRANPTYRVVPGRDGCWLGFKHQRAGAAWNAQFSIMPPLRCSACNVRSLGYALRA